MMTQTYWSCPLCKDTKHYKGLCRICTVYNSDGIVKEAIHRERVDENGQPWVKQKYIPTVNRDMEMMKARFLDQRRRKLTKQQKAAIKAKADELKAAQKEIVKEAETSGEDIIDIGESVDEEE